MADWSRWWGHRAAARIRGSDPQHLFGSPGISATVICRRRSRRGTAYQARSRHRSDGERARRTRDRDRSAVRYRNAAPMPAAAMRTLRKAIRTTTTGHDHSAPIMAITVIAMTTIAMTSIATMTITAIPMLMTTIRRRPSRGAGGGASGLNQASPPQRIGGQEGMTESEAAALYRLMTWLSPSFPVGAFLLFQRHRMGGRSRRYRGCASLRDWLASHTRRMDRDFATGYCWPTPTAPRPPATVRDCGISPSLRLPSCPRVSGSSRHRRRDARLSISRALHGIATGSTIDFGIATAPSSIRRGWSGQRRACDPSRATMPRFLHALTSNWISAARALFARANR